MRHGGRTQSFEPEQLIDRVVINFNSRGIYQELICRHVKCETLLEYPNGDVNYTVGSANPETV